MGGRCRVWSLVLCVAACASRAAAAPSVACHEYAQAACAGEAVHSFVLETGACYSNEEVRRARPSTSPTHRVGLRTLKPYWMLGMRRACVLKLSGGLLK